MSHVIIGTAGHIDHGKTALVKALTGIDTDRLKEEKERGLTIDLGFAHLGDKATIIDVPGHEKFIRNMVAGVSTIDLVLFVVAADDGVMPQTREHLDILNILQLKHGIIVITKADLVETDWLALVKEDIQNLTKGTFLQDAPIFAVSSTTGMGIPELQSGLDQCLATIRHQPETSLFWMPVDRSFTMRGFGTVVTGSILSGQAREGQELELLPQKRLVKIRGLQTHGQHVRSVTTGDRAAINLQAIEKSHIHRGNVLAEAGYFTPTRRIDARLRLLRSAPKALKTRSRVRFHVGTSEVMARIMPYGVAKIEPGANAFVQIRLESPAVARRLDPFVIRQYSPTLTIGGGLVLDADPPRRKFSDPGNLEKLALLEKDDPLEVIEGRLLSAEPPLLTLEKLSSDTAIDRERVANYLDELEKQKKTASFEKSGQTAVIHSVQFNHLKNQIIDALSRYHKSEPASLGIRKGEFQNHLPQKTDADLLDFALDDLKRDDRIKEASGLLSLKGHEIHLSAKQQQLQEKTAALLYEAGFMTPSESEIAETLSATPQTIGELLMIMTKLGEVVRLEGNIYLHPKRVQEAREKITAFLDKNGEITVSHFKDLLGGASRKYAMPLLIYFDSIGLTEREGDVRVLRNA